MRRTWTAAVVGLVVGLLHSAPEAPRMFSLSLFLMAACTDVVHECRRSATEFDDAARLDPAVRSDRWRAYDFINCKPACEDKKDVGACYTMAHMYGLGAGIGYRDGVDHARAAEYAKRACEIRGTSPCSLQARHLCLDDLAGCAQRCESGGAVECATLAGLIDHSVEKQYDPGKAGELHRRACEGGVEASCKVWRRHHCVADIKACQKACDGGDARLCFQVADHFEKGWGGVVSDKMVSRYQIRACQLDVTVHEGCAALLATLE